jgi:hypothetical protein
MPSPPGYHRNYKHEWATAKKRGEDKGNAERHVARRLEMKKGLVHPFDHKDIDHKKPLSKGGANTESNFRIESEHANRSFPRTHTGALKVNHAKKK